MTRFFIVARLWMLALFSYAAIPLLESNTAWAEPLLQRQGLTGVTVIERTGDLCVLHLAPEDRRLIERVADVNPDTADLKTTSKEYFDVFVSDAQGKPDSKGAFLTIEGRSDADSAGSGFNIAGIFLTYFGRTRVLASSITHYVPGNRSFMETILSKAVDLSIHTHTGLGNGGLMAMTVGFPELPQPDSGKSATIAGTVRELAKPPLFTQMVRVPGSPEAPKAATRCKVNGDGAEELLILPSRGTEIELLSGRAPNIEVIDLKGLEGDALVCLRLGSGNASTPIVWDKRHQKLGIASRAEGGTWNVSEQELPVNSASLQILRGAKGRTDRLATISKDGKQLGLSSQILSADSWTLSPIVSNMQSITRALPIDTSGEGSDSLLVVDEDRNNGGILFIPGSSDGTPYFEPLAEDTMHFYAGEPTVGNANTDENEDFFFLSRQGDVLVSSSNGVIPGPVRLFTATLGYVDHFLIADVDGDKLSDVLFKPHAGKYWLLARNIHGLENLDNLELEGSQGIPSDKMFVVDINGDGLDDLAGFDEKTSAWLVFASRASVPLQGATLELDGALKTVSDADGAFQLQQISAGAHHLRVDAPGHESFTDWSFSGEHANIVLHHARDNVCVGFVPGTPTPWAQNRERCPDNYAILAIDDPGRGQLLDRAPGIFTCCPLPAGDILTTDFVLVKEFCPEDTLATGYVSEHERFLVRCTRINTQRYALSESARGHYWGFGFSKPGSEPQLRKSDIPIALRYALGRTGRHAWDVDGCVGFPPGSAFIGRSTGGCEGTLFKQLLYKSSGGQPAKPVEMLPPCKAISSPFDAKPSCMR